MENKSAEEAMRELTMILIYLSRFKNTDRFRIDDTDDWFAWKGYDFDVLNELNDEDYIRQGSRPSRSKSVYLTEAGIAFAKELMAKYHIDDWEKN